MLINDDAFHCVWSVTAKAFRRVLQSIRQGDEGALTYQQLGDGTIETLVLFPNASCKTFPIYVNMTMMLSLKPQLQDLSCWNANKSHCLGLEVMVVAWARTVQRGGLVTGEPL